MMFICKQKPLHLHCYSVTWPTTKYGDPILRICALYLTHPKCTHSSELTPGAVGSLLCCGTWGAVGRSVPGSRAPQSWYWRWIFTPPTYNSCRPETLTRNLSITSPTLTSRPRLPPGVIVLHLSDQTICRSVRVCIAQYAALCPPAFHVSSTSSHWPFENLHDMLALLVPLSCFIPVVLCVWIEPYRSPQKCSDHRNQFRLKTALCSGICFLSFSVHNRFLQCLNYWGSWEGLRPPSSSHSPPSYM